MAIPDAWLSAEYALLHGEDGEGRRAALEAWKARHVDPEWVDFSLTVCPEGCPWPEVQNALMETAPFGAVRVVVVPQAENLLERPKELPAPVKALLAQPIPGTRLLLVSRAALSGGPGRILGSKPFSDWEKQGRVLKVGALDARGAAAFVEARAGELGLKLEAGVAPLLAARLGGNPGVLSRALEVLDLLAEDRRVARSLVDVATFRIGEQGAFAWSEAWQKGNLALALEALCLALEDEPSAAPLMLLGQARRSVDQLARPAEARSRGLRSAQERLAALGLSPKQGFVLERCERVLDRGGTALVDRLVQLVQATDLDLKGRALNQSPTPLVVLTASLARAWGG